MTIYRDLGLDKLDCTVAIIKNARSNKMGKKDIIKVECPIEDLDLDIVGFIDHNITVNIIKDGNITQKKELSLPKQIVNVIKCKNPRCITSIEQELDHVFILADPRHAPASPPWLREVVVRAEGFWLFDRVCGAEMRDKIGVW